MEDASQLCVEREIAVWHFREVDYLQRRCYESCHEWLAHSHYIRHVPPPLLAYVDSLLASPKYWWNQMLK
jgi:hypothetical protein